MANTSVFHLTLVAVLLGITLSSTLSSAPTKYFECEVYPGNEDVDQTRRECIRETVDNVERLYCKHWECDTPDCPEDERLTEKDGCQYCPGTCTIGGKIHKVGTAPPCVDNVNTCRCFATGSVSTTFIGYDRYRFCNSS